MEFCNIRKESFLFGHGCWNTPVGGEISVTSFYYFVRDNDREKVFSFLGGSENQWTSNFLSSTTRVMKNNDGEEENVFRLKDKKAGGRFTRKWGAGVH